MEAASPEECQSGFTTNPNQLIAFCHDIRRSDGQTFFGAEDSYVAVIVARDPVAPKKPNAVLAISNRVTGRPIRMIRENRNKAPDSVLQSELSAAAKGNPKIACMIPGDR